MVDFLSSTTSETPISDPLESALNSIRHQLREGQRQMAGWQGGELAVSAVPGSGKSTGMAGAAAIAIAQNRLHTRHQLVVVTFTRSAAASLKGKIRRHLQTLGLPSTGFVVHTLHGLALQIATRHPELSTLSLDALTLISPNRSHQLLRQSVENWANSHPRLYQRLLEGNQSDGEETERLRRQGVLRTEVLPYLAYTAIHEAKSSGLLPSDLLELAQIQESQTSGEDYPILRIAAGLYETYQQQLRSRSLIDYDDMILGALRVLQDVGARRLWQNQVFAVFEDEAQDSSPLQAKLLEILAQEDSDSIGAGSVGMGLKPAPTRENGDKPTINLMRVGDPNQAINSTFTPADPIYFRQFCDRLQTQNQLIALDCAGRSSPIILRAANFMLQWVNRHIDNQNQPAPLPFSEQLIKPVPPEDPQPDANPAPEGKGLELYSPRDVFQAVEWIGDRIHTLFTQDPYRSAAVLVRTNDQGRFVAHQLREKYGTEINLFEVAESDRHSHVPAEILNLLNFLERPHSPDALKAALTVLVNRRLIPPQDLNALASLPEVFLYPGPLDSPGDDTSKSARRYCRALLRARIDLPLYQLIPFLGLTLRYSQNELATADKLAERVTQQTLGDSSLSALLRVLTEIVQSERFEPVEVDTADDSPYMRPNQLTIITMHKAKGLDWDYVFLPFLHKNMIPGSFWTPPQTRFLGEFSLAEVARAQIRAHLHGDPIPEGHQAWIEAEQLKTAEEYRLLYVAMTRAKRLLWMSAANKSPFTWSKFNVNRQMSLQAQPVCPVFPALKRQFPESGMPIKIDP
ncbi:ATP-dependent helicase [Roseofilum capinflatum]|uniref:DNA 3'-5' helicase n=1 Tax=Roseofilum capinflatum BLCC-M114 TaxID=3022440 RepID=A0ABT7B8M5_9CYAN|nr:ATP-dependent helicase [Roseofilum capinflatum]MDJ1175510.1 ATP-dependent helicase [Roseofilum capinflatum BLCC-M114]